MEYRVILTVNDKYRKTFIRCKTKETAFMHFHKMKNNSVIFPKRFVNTGDITPVKYKLCITKITEKTDTFRTLRDDYGKVYVEPPIGGWTILHSDDFDIEERFWIYGRDPKKNRPTITEIIKKLMSGAFSKNMIKQVIVVHNKLIIYNESQFDMVICKNILDAQRLHHTLAKIAKKQKVKSILFMGTATNPFIIGKLYDLIKEQTKWSYLKISRTTTRP